MADLTYEGHVKYMAGYVECPPCVKYVSTSRKFVFSFSVIRGSVVIETLNGICSVGSPSSCYAVRTYLRPMTGDDTESSYIAIPSQHHYMLYTLLKKLIRKLSGTSK